ncbi:MAG: hypothetical protein JNK25_09105 [Phycisphaerae bacterium]|nr:hypothetical protein [Phycisphaerae bacterium]
MMRDGEVRGRRLLREEPPTEDRPHSRWVTVGLKKRLALRGAPAGPPVEVCQQLCERFINVEKQQVLLSVPRSTAPEWVEWRTRRFLGLCEEKQYNETAVRSLLGDAAILACKEGMGKGDCCCKKDGGGTQPGDCIGCGSSPNMVKNCHCNCAPPSVEVDCSRLHAWIGARALPAGFVTRELVEWPDTPDRLGRKRYQWVVQRTAYDEKNKRHVPTGLVYAVFSSTVISPPHTTVMKIRNISYQIEWEDVSVRGAESVGPSWIERRVRGIKEVKLPISRIEDVPFAGTDDGDRSGEECYIERNGQKIKGTLVCVKDPQSGAYYCSCITPMPHLVNPPENSPPA